ncbi:helix-turn-helix domain-containing protein [Fimbriiglobus ruber]|uniref:helix-turn-helix domain-containing protein n=1 Tax=Fimbriiglobus ruber TaxID=1908690 RepID=UPI000B4B3FEE
MNSSPSPDSLPDISPDQFERVLALVAAIAKSAPGKTEPKYLTVEDAAAYCRVAVQTIYNNRRYIERMPGVRKLLFTREALDAWLANRKNRRRAK